MGKKLKLKVKRGKLKVKMKSDGERLPLGEGDIRGLLALAMANALGTGALDTDGRLLEDVGTPALLTAGDPAKPESVETPD